eukprot:8711436-Prorocentrum_lima.AAC.1
MHRAMRVTWRIVPLDSPWSVILFDTSRVEEEPGVWRAVPLGTSCIGEEEGAWCTAPLGVS